MTALFLFGTLLDDALRGIVLGDVGEGRDATLGGHRVERAQDGDHPVLVANPGSVAGRLVDVDEAAMARADFYEAGFAFVRDHVTVETATGPVEAVVYRAATPCAGSGQAWHLSAWAGRWGALTRRAAVEVMDLMGDVAAEDLPGLMGPIRVRASAQMRAAMSPKPTAVRSATHRDAVEVAARRRPYTGFFAVDEFTLRHPKFGGGLSRPLDRAAWRTADAVVVLPYDPAMDAVLLIEQFRMGPFTRGDPHPWILEPVAGRIDPGETGEEAAHREAMEEAHLAFHKLIPIARYYPSPGTMDEYIENFVGLADLSGRDGTIGGAEDEGEDIRSHIVPFQQLMQLVDSGEIDAGPLLTSIFWLTLNRGRPGGP